MTKPKRYVVRKGKKTGIFSSREECKAVVHGYAGAQYKSYESLAAAEQAFASSYVSQITQKTKDQRLAIKDYRDFVDHNSISVDAACSDNPGILERQ
jgi:ribonuclease HI